MASLVGGFCVGLFATKEGCEAFGITNGRAAIAGNGRQVFIKYVLCIPLHMTEQQLEGNDDMVHGEVAYMLGPCEAHVQSEGRSVSMGGNEDAGEGVMGRVIEEEKDEEGVVKEGVVKRDVRNGSATGSGSQE
ncbi:hypothetical protein ACMFMG_005158 [Clarireedia jacksonii]